MSAPELTPAEKRNLRYYELYFRLPKNGVRAAFPTEEDCRLRLETVRWGGEPKCPACNQRAATWLTKRQIHRCRACAHQFSVTSRTYLHRTRIPLSVWFEVAEILIKNTVGFGGDFRIPVDVLHARFEEISYKSLHRTRALIEKDLESSPGGLLSFAISVQLDEVPPVSGQSPRERRAQLMRRYFRNDSHQ